MQSALLTANAVNMRNDVIISLGGARGARFHLCAGYAGTRYGNGPCDKPFHHQVVRNDIHGFQCGTDGRRQGRDGLCPDIPGRGGGAGAHNPHRVRSRQIGNMYMIALDIEVDGTISVTEAHRIANEVERSIKARIDNIYDIVVHVEPEGVHHDAEKFGIDRGMV